MGAKGVQPRDIARKFPRAVQKALEETVNKLEDQFKKEIKSSTWPWYSVGGAKQTFRKNGRVVGEPRDIVDLGNLLNSQTEPQQTSKYSFLIKWEVNYSAIVHDGGTLKNGGFYPQRPWTKTGEDKVQPLGYFADILRRELDG